MPAREFRCKILETKWLTPTVFSIRFEPSKKFSYLPGQFLSVIVPIPSENSKLPRRIYSFASSGKGDGYELCIRKVQNGLGSTYLASLKEGDFFQASAPYGDFLFETKPHRNACFVTTGSGIAPFKSFVSSEHFLKRPPQAALLLFGAHHESEIIYPGFFEKQGIEVVHAISTPSSSWNGFKGRVSHFLTALPENWPWSETDFYLCGNGYMVKEVSHYLATVRQVSKAAIHQEAYFSTHAPRIEVVQSIEAANFIGEAA